jgi:hypothetical protein
MSRTTISPWPGDPMELAVEEYTVTRAVSGALGVVAIALHHQAKHSRTASKDQHINSPGAFPFFFSSAENRALLISTVPLINLSSCFAFVTNYILLASA